MAPGPLGYFASAIHSRHCCLGTCGLDALNRRSPGCHRHAPRSRTGCAPTCGSRNAGPVTAIARDARHRPDTAAPIPQERTCARPPSARPARRRRAPRSRTSALLHEGCAGSSGSVCSRLSRAIACCPGRPDRSGTTRPSPPAPRAGRARPPCSPPPPPDLPARGGCRRQPMANRPSLCRSAAALSREIRRGYRFLARGSPPFSQAALRSPIGGRRACHVRR